jgi:hypothetical protein
MLSSILKSLRTRWAFLNAFIYLLSNPVVSFICRQVRIHGRYYMMRYLIMLQFLSPLGRFLKWTIMVSFSVRTPAVSIYSLPFPFQTEHGRQRRMQR